jgi:uncharacterized membrane protein
MFLKLYFLSLPLFLGLDFAWLTFVARKFYADNLGSLMKPTPNLPAAIIFYLIYLAGFVYFVMLPNFSSKSLLTTVLSGAAFGFIAYATYDLTNLATLKNWPLSVTIVDILWGAFASGFIASLTTSIASKFNW